jgi:uncharacterized Zn finger protein (UPF0148 family)
MIIASCPKCGVPLWRGNFQDIPEEDVKCWICEMKSQVPSCDQYSPNEWREALMNEEKLVQARNIFHVNMRAVAEKMDLPQYLIEWGLLDLEDIEMGDKGEVSKIFQEEIKWMIEKILTRLTERRAELAS